MSFQNLLGEGVLVPSQLSLESAVTGDTPPTFLWATVGDNTVPVENTMLYATALRRAGVPFELHLYGRRSPCHGPGHGGVRLEAGLCESPRRHLARPVRGVDERTEVR